MNRKAMQWTVGLVAILTLVLATGTLADEDGPVHFGGTLHDYTPVMVSKGQTVGPYEIHGTWSLNLHGESGQADFSAALTMETSDYGIVEGIVDPAKPGTRHPHTHNIALTGAAAISDAAQVQADCPASAPATPPFTPLLEVTGLANVSGTGGSPFGEGVLVQLQVCIAGGTNVRFSNITLVFPQFQPDGSPNPGAGHFGSQPIYGVVREARLDQGGHRDQR